MNHRDSALKKVACSTAKGADYRGRPDEDEYAPCDQCGLRPCLWVRHSLNTGVSGAHGAHTTTDKEDRANREWHVDAHARER
jgi:hypothetical protein